MNMATTARICWIGATSAVACKYICSSHDSTRKREAYAGTRIHADRTLSMPLDLEGMMKAVP